MEKPAISAVQADNVIELGAALDDHPWSDLPAREIPADDWQRFRGYCGGNAPTKRRRCRIGATAGLHPGT